MGKYGPEARKTIKKIEISSCLPKSMVRFVTRWTNSVCGALIVTSVSMFLDKSFVCQYQIWIIIQKLCLAMNQRGHNFGLSTNRYSRTHTRAVTDTLNLLRPLFSRGGHYMWNQSLIIIVPEIIFKEVNFSIWKALLMKSCFSRWGFFENSWNL